MFRHFDKRHPRVSEPCITLNDERLFRLQIISSQDIWPSNEALGRTIIILKRLVDLEIF